MAKKTRENIDINVGPKGPPEEKYILNLYISGIHPNSSHAVVNIKSICEKYLKGRYELEIIDIYQQPDFALLEEIIAIPLLIKLLPLPVVRFIGDLSDTEKVLKELQII